MEAVESRIALKFCVFRVFVKRKKNTYQSNMDKYLHLPDKCILLMAGALKRNLSLYKHNMKSDTIAWGTKNVIVPEGTGTAVAQWLSCCATNRKVAGSIPAGVIGIFHLHKILPIALWRWGRLSL